MANTKSQVQMMETIGVLFIFFILIGFGFKFYGVIIQKNYEREKFENFQLQTIQAAQYVSFMPELKCSEDIVKEREDCIDILKLIEAKNIIANKKAEYYDSFGYASISITQIYPSNYPAILGTPPWIIYENTLSEDKLADKSIIRIPIALLNPKNSHTYLGIVEVEAQRPVS